ncbi:Transcription initiation factor [Drechslerella dactyloides]|uniref:Transcription initiation factor IIF subunit beta n=1 Tax=Drechslerella dactyloides TaxID=74499 RepID=A0AAD6NFL1_DREDA|nr:Transcription initiation factor [Drechslerella dactyloides]
MASAAPVIKVEDDSKPPAIKSENVTMEDAPFSAPSPLTSDDEQFEDAGDLDMTKGNVVAWLVKMPDFLLENWHKIDDDEEIHLANIRVFHNTAASANPAAAGTPTLQNDPPQEKLKLVLTDSKYNAGIPQKFDMVVTDRNVRNTFVFTEKDMPGFENKARGVGNDGNPIIPSRLLQPEKTQDRKFGKGNNNKKFTPFFRKAIPKRTALAGTVRHEAVVTPADNMEFARYLKRKRDLMEEEQRRKHIQVLEKIMPGAPLPSTNDNLFDQAIQKPGPDKKKTQENKATRMPRNELLDALFVCFSEYEFWTLKGLRERLNQPEAYLKETLESIASLLKTGPFALKWQLKPEYKSRDIEAIKKEVREDLGTDAGEDFDEDDDEELEDMKI